MYKSKRYSYSYEDVDEGGKNAKTLVEDMINDPELKDLEEIVIGCWGEAWAPEGGIQPVIDGIVENKEKFSHIKSMFFADMDYEECEVSWIIQGDYSKFWSAFPQLEKVTIKGSTDLHLGRIEHANLKEFEIICGGLGKDVIKEVQEAKLPSLEKLLLYLGMEEYGFDALPEDIGKLLANSDFPNLTYLGLTDSDVQDEVVELIFDSKYASQIEVLDISNGTLTDKGGEIVCDKIKNFPNIKRIDAHYHYMNDEMMDKWKVLPCEVNVEEPNEIDEYDGELYLYPMLGE